MGTVNQVKTIEVWLVSAGRRMELIRRLKRLEELNAQPEVRKGFRNQDACLAWVNEVVALLAFNAQYYGIASVQAQLLSRSSLSASLLGDALRTIVSQVEQAIAELRGQIERAYPTARPPSDVPTTIGMDRFVRVALLILQRLQSWVPEHWQWRLDRLLARKQARRIEKLMEQQQYRNDDHEEAMEELNHRSYYRTDQIREHQDERLLQRNIRRGIEVPQHGSREEGPNEDWQISQFTGQWLLTHNGRAATRKSWREYWISVLRRWQIGITIAAGVFTLIGIFWPDFRSAIGDVLKQLLSKVRGGP